MKKILMIILLMVNPIAVNAEQPNQWEPPVVDEWYDEVPYDSEANVIEDTWAYDPEGEFQYVLLGKDGVVIERSDEIDFKKLEHYSLPLTVKVEVPNGEEVSIEYSTFYGNKITINLNEKNEYLNTVIMPFNKYDVKVLTEIAGYYPLYVDNIKLYDGNNKQLIRFVKEDYIDRENLDIANTEEYDEAFIEKAQKEQELHNLINEQKKIIEAQKIEQNSASNNEEKKGENTIIENNNTNYEQEDVQQNTFGKYLFLLIPIVSIVILGIVYVRKKKK